MKVLRLLPVLALVASMVSFTEAYELNAAEPLDMVEWNEYLQYPESDDEVVIGDYLNTGGLKTQRTAKPKQPGKIGSIPRPISPKGTILPRTAVLNDVNSLDDLSLSAQELNYQLDSDYDLDDSVTWNEYLSTGNNYLDAENKGQAKKQKKSKKSKSKKFKNRGLGGQEVEDFEYVSVEPLIGESVDFDAQISPRAGGPTHKHVEGKFAYCASCKLGAVAELCPTCGDNISGKTLDYYGDEYFTENDIANLGTQLDASGSEVTDARHGSR